MFKKILTTLILSVMVISVMGCSKSGGNETAATETTTEEETFVKDDQWALQVNQKIEEYKDRPTGEIVFYGASNFTLWRTMEEDMMPYVVQNHGFGGSTDNDLMAYAEDFLYPYEPNIVFFQTGSNDLAEGLTVEEVIANKDKMYTLFRNHLSDATFIVMSGLPLPGRSEYWEDTKLINQELEDYCETHDNMYFIDATSTMLDAEGNFRPELFKEDGIHLNADGHALWTELMKQKLEEIQ